MVKAAERRENIEIERGERTKRKRERGNKCKKCVVKWRTEERRGRKLDKDKYKGKMEEGKTYFRQSAPSRCCYSDEISVGCGNI